MKRTIAIIITAAALGLAGCMPATDPAPPEAPQADCGTADAPWGENGCPVHDPSLPCGEVVCLGGGCPPPCDP